MVQTGYTRSELRSVLELQKFDSEIKRLRTAIDRTVKDPDVEALRARTAAAIHSAQAAKERAVKLKHSVAFEEKGSDGIRAEITAAERKMYGGMVGNPKELEKMQERVGQLRADLSRHDETGLGALVELEEAEPARVRANQAQDESRALLAAAEGRQKETVAGLERQVTELQPKRAESAVRVPERLRIKYERIRDTHAGVGVAAIRRDGLCAACLVEVPKSLAKAVLDGSLETCETCGRLLIHLFESADGGE